MKKKKIDFFLKFCSPQTSLSKRKIVRVRLEKSGRSSSSSGMNQGGADLDRVLWAFSVLSFFHRSLTGN